MPSLRRFAVLSWSEQWLLLRALFLIAVLRVSLWTIPFGLLQRISFRPPRKRSGAMSPAKLAWAVSAVSRRMPGATCLTQAIATQILLARSGYQSRVEIGVAKNERSDFEAHAWVVCGDSVLIGGPVTDRYTRLAGWEVRP